MILKIDTPDRPASVALTTAFEDAIENIATDQLTHIEVLGCLDFVSKKYYENYLSEDA